MHRRAAVGGRLVGRVAALLLVGALAVACFEDASSADRPRNLPNILLILTDDQPVGTFSVMPETKRLLAQEGVTFTNSFAAVPNCCPSRASLFTGRYAHNHGVLNNREGAAEEMDQRATVQRHLQRQGYRTAIIGKYLNKWDLEQDPPYFDEWAIYAGSESNRSHYFDGRWNVGGQLATIEEYSTDFIKDRALDFLQRADRRDDGQPWFLQLSVIAPHAMTDAYPYPEARYLTAAVPRWRKNPAVNEKNRSDKQRVVQVQDHSERAETNRRRQLQALMSVDDLVSEVMGGLEALDEDANTLAIYTSDNGLLWGEHRVSTKLFPYTRSIGVPLLVRWPNRLPAGKVDERLVSGVDIAPTMLEAARVPTDRLELDGRPLLSASSPRERILIEFYTEGLRLTSWASIRTPSWQFIEYYGKTRGVSDLLDGSRDRIIFREFYDLEKDPWQLRNLLGDRDPRNDPWVWGLTRLLAADRRCSGARCP